MEQAPCNSAPPVNVATAVVLGTVGAGSTLPMVVAGTDGENPVCADADDEPDLEGLMPDVIDAVGEHPRKLGMVMLTPAQSWELNDIASVRESVQTLGEKS